MVTSSLVVPSPTSKRALFGLVTARWVNSGFPEKARPLLLTACDPAPTVAPPPDQLTPIIQR
jgi:hypothetical protein